MVEPLEGGVYVDRRILNHSVFLRPDYGWAWVYLLLLANDKDRTIMLGGQRLEVKRGQLARSLKGLQLKLGKGRKWFTAFLEFCKDEGMITVKSFSHGSIITVVNYDAYNPVTKSETEIDRQAEAHNNQKKPEVHQVQSAACSEMPDDREVKNFCDSFTDLSRGITQIPEIWWQGWLSMMMSRPNFPKDWKLALKRAFISDWLGGHWKARGGIKNGQTPVDKPLYEPGELRQLIAMAKQRGAPQSEIDELRNELAQLGDG